MGAQPALGNKHVPPAALAVASRAESKAGPLLLPTGGVLYDR